MANNFYSHSSVTPVAQSRGLSSPIRAEFDSITAAFDSVSQNVMGFATESGALNNFVLTITPTPAAYPTKATMVFVATHANTGPATIQIGALATIPLYANDGTAMTSNYIKSGELVTVYVTAAAAYMLGATKSYVDNSAFTSALPAQSGNAGKVIVTDGTNASWGSAIAVLTTGNGTVAAPAISLGDATTGLYRTAVNQVAFAVAGALAMLVDAGKSLNLYANLIFAGLAQRITGDMSNATTANRVNFQSNTLNGVSIVGVIPNGTGATSGFSASSSADPDNSSIASLLAVAGSDVRHTSGLTGTGVYLPMTFYTGGIQRMSISAAGIITDANGIEFGGKTLIQNIQSASYTLTLADAGRHIFHPSGDTSARTWTIPAGVSVAFPLGTAITLVNQNGGGVITVAITSDVMRVAGSGAIGSRALAANGIATLLKVTSTEWIISGTGLT